MNEHQVQWTAPSLLWAETANATDPAVRQTLSQPAILRFASDYVHGRVSGDVGERPRTSGWAGRAAGNLAWADAPPTSAALLAPTAAESSLARKLQRLRRVARKRLQRQGRSRASAIGTEADVAQPTSSSISRRISATIWSTACLVCGLTGLPDRTLDTAARSAPPSSCAAWCLPTPANTTALRAILDLAKNMPW